MEVLFLVCIFSTTVHQGFAMSSSPSIAFLASSALLRNSGNIPSYTVLWWVSKFQLLIIWVFFVSLLFTASTVFTTIIFHLTRRPHHPPIITSVHDLFHLLLVHVLLLGRCFHAISFAFNGSSLHIILLLPAFYFPHFQPTSLVNIEDFLFCFIYDLNSFSLMWPFWLVTQP